MEAPGQVQNILEDNSGASGRSGSRTQIRLHLNTCVQKVVTHDLPVIRTKHVVLAPKCKLYHMGGRGDCKII
ncbi:hypothetical protein GDO81_023395 [Engystomops pustulosus]|uniref:Uncharacterized protein n=1 Tax=Engystomops pustulosus TaxID=76066 RepID=A0AAV6YT01_ENGPU|nr:hypothetical protein GDO81_023396 [Engystomops pustulosus]KAG8538036.1 hypothetical protein GDO81_023395 [Engystomops pustulosus]